MAVVLVIAAAKLLLHLATASRYGYFGDELYFMACGEHLDWGYVDQPPLVALVAWIVRHTLGTSLLATRLPSALAGAALVILTGLLARELGGGRFAMGLSALASGLAFVYVVMHYLFTMNAFEPLLWTGCAYVVVRIVKTGNQRLWLVFGAIAGLGLQNKYSMAVFAFALVAGVTLSPERRAFTKPWIWLGERSLSWSSCRTSPGTCSTAGPSSSSCGTSARAGATSRSVLSTTWLARSST